MEAYHAAGYSATSDDAPAPDLDADRSVPMLSNYRAVREAIPLSAYAGQLTELRRRGDRHVGRCPLPDHEDVTPSFVVFPNGHWHCFGCGRHGDVIDLHRHAENFAESYWALIDLSIRHGVELPGRPERWYEHQADKANVLNAAEETRKRAFRRRAFKVAVVPYLKDTLRGADEDTIRGEVEAAWLDFEAAMQRVGR